jgi:hypothetical protein
MASEILKAIAGQIRRLVGKPHREAMDLCGRLLLEAVKEGAFSGIQNLQFRRRLETSFYKVADPSGPKPSEMLPAAIDFLAKAGKLPGGVYVEPQEWAMSSQGPVKVHDSMQFPVMISGYIEQNFQALADLIEGFSSGENIINRHSDDFRSVLWYGLSYAFTKSQAACMKVLWRAWETKTPELDGLTVVTQADIAQVRLIDVFRSKGKSHSAWGTMIIKGQSKGAYRLSDGAIVTQTKSGRKQSRKTTRKIHR